MKRLISILLLVTLVFSLFSINAIAAEEGPEIVIESVKYNKSTKEITIIGTARCDQVIVQVWTTTGTKKMLVFYAFETYSGSFNKIFNNIELEDGTYTVKAANYYGGTYATKSLVIKSSKPYVPPATPAPTPTPTPQVTADSGKSIITITPQYNDTTKEQKSSLDKNTYNEALSLATENEEGVKIIVLKAPVNEGAKSYIQELPASILASGTGKEKLQIETGIGSITAPSNMLSNIKDLDTEKDIALVIAKADISELNEAIRNTIGDRPVVSLNLQIDGKATSWNNPNAPVTITIPYAPTAQELKDPEHIVVWYIDGEGNVISVPSGKYDQNTKSVVFDTTHFSLYSVAYVKKTYVDIADSYAKKQIEVLASKGFYSWIKDDNFTPTRNITRAEFLYLVMSALNLDTDFDDNFNDVKKTDYYYQAIGTAKKLGITKGVGNSNYGVNQSITRQDMSTILVNALKVAKLNYPDGSTAELKKFTDNSKIASYAESSLATLVKAGVLVGYNNILDPDGSFNMQQAAVIIYKIYNK